ncbi:MAG: SDR family oxidoreductase [Candidatus Paceibacterota bacterium]|jgi:NAD(P)-dependent dehydrogenase (short-subunit alcohol dehydrogenase family)
MNKNLRIAVVAGGMGFVGSAIVRHLAQDGFIIALLYHTTKEDVVDQALARLSGGGHRAYQCDFGDTRFTKEVLKRIEGEIGPIFAVIDASGSLPRPKQLSASSLEDVREQFEAGVFGSFNFLSNCVSRLKEHKEGVIVGITTAGVVTDRNTKARGAYSMVKYAVQGMLVAFREELAAYSIRVYSVAPGVMAGGLNKATPKAFLDMVREKIPSKKLATAEDVAEQVAILCSEASQNVKTLTVLVAPECVS